MLTQVLTTSYPFPAEPVSFRYLSQGDNAVYAFAQQASDLGNVLSWFYGVVTAGAVPDGGPRIAFQDLGNVFSGALNEFQKPVQFDDAVTLYGGPLAMTNGSATIENVDWTFSFASVVTWSSNSFLNHEGTMQLGSSFVMNATGAAFNYDSACVVDDASAMTRTGPTTFQGASATIAFRASSSVPLGASVSIDDSVDHWVVQDDPSNNSSVTVAAPSGHVRLHVTLSSAGLTTRTVTLVNPDTTVICLFASTYTWTTPASGTSKSGRVWLEWSVILSKWRILNIQGACTPGSPEY